MEFGESFFFSKKAFQFNRGEASWNDVPVGELANGSGIMGHTHTHEKDLWKFDPSLRARSKCTTPTPSSRHWGLVDWTQIFQLKIHLQVISDLRQSDHVFFLPYQPIYLGNRVWIPRDLTRWWESLHFCWWMEVGSSYRVWNLMNNGVPSGHKHTLQFTQVISTRSYWLQFNWSMTLLVFFGQPIALLPQINNFAQIVSAVCSRRLINRL